MSKALLILGMHRSGTSALTGTLKQLGVDVGDNLLAEANENPKGFWEHAGIVELHERLLETLDSSWHDERALPDRWWQHPDIQPLRKEIELTLERDFGSSELWAVKDPRMCRLMLLWRDILKAVGSSPHIIIILRDPLEVAASLRDRDGINLQRGSLLWLRHILEAERATRNYPRVIITYEQLLHDWRSTIESIGSMLNLNLQNHIGDNEEAVDRFLEPSLRHHNSAKPTDHPIADQALSAYQLLASTDNQPAIGQLEHLYEQLSDWNDLLSPWLEPIQRLHRELENSRKTIYQRERENRHLRKHPAFRLFVQPWIRS